MTLKNDKIRAAQLLLNEALLLDDTATAQRIVSVAAGQNLQTAIDTAQSGDVIELEAGATFEGNFILRGAFAEAVTIRSAGRYGSERMTPQAALPLAIVRAPRGGAPAFATAPGAQGFTLSCLDIPNNPGGFSDLIRLGDGSPAQFRLDDVPSRFIIDRCYLHGDPGFGQKRGIALNCSDALISLCTISDIFVVGQDSQAINGWNGPGHYTISGNYLEAASENLIFGSADATVPNLVPSDITINENIFTKKSAWKNRGYNIKNLFELKSARQVVFRDNRLSNCWGEAQTGYGVQLTPRNQDGGAPWSTVEDVLIAHNEFEGMAAAINFLGTDTNRISGRMKRVQVVGNTFTHIDPLAFTGSAKIFQVSDGPEDITLDNNTISGANFLGMESSVLYFAGGQKSLRFIFINNRYPQTDYGIFGASSSAGGDPPHAWVDYTDKGILGGNVVTP